jgi:branched-chain amino acid transport system ATP-binding protein
VLLNVQNLSVSYGGIKALRNVSLQIAPGEIVTLIGSNGAGKTTLLRTISGLLRPVGGDIQWHADSIPPARPAPAGLANVTAPAEHDPAASRHAAVLNRLPPHEIVRLGISHVPEGRQIFANLTVRENLMIGAYTRKDRRELREEIQAIYARFPVLRERQSQRAGTLSGGEQQMLAIGRALMAKPRLLLLDEPSLGLAPLVVKKIFQIIREINAAGTTIFLVEQNARMALNVANRGYVLQSGQVILSDDAKKLLDDPEVRKAYLGG